MKIIVLLLLQLLSIQAWAQLRHVVFDLDGTLVVNVPKRFKDNSPDKQAYLTIDERNRLQTYRIYPHAMAALESIWNSKNYVVHIRSNKDKATIEAILSGLKTSIIKNQNLKSLYDDQDLAKIFDESFTDKDGRFDLRKVSSDVSKVLYFTTKPNTLIAAQAGLEVTLPVHYFYEDYDQLQKEKTQLMNRDDWATVHQSAVPVDEATWKHSNYRMLDIKEILSEISVNKGESLASAYRRISAPSDPRLSFALQWAENNYSYDKVSWVISSNKVSGCKQLNLKTSESKLVDQKVCLGLFKTISYKLEGGSCSLFTNDFLLIGPSDDCKSRNFVKLNSATQKYELQFVEIPVPKFSLFDTNTSAGSVYGISLPRVNHTFYRGMKSGQYNIWDAISAMFGDTYAGVESKLITSMKQYLQGKPSSLGVTFDSRMKNGMDKAMRDRGGDFRDEREAKMLAFEISDSVLTQKRYTDKVAEYVNYTSGRFQDWAPDILFGTVYYWGATWYGEMIVMYKDYHKRGNDLNWTNQSFGQAKVDVGEYILPLEIRADEIIGFQQSSIGESYVKVTHNKKDYVLVLGSSYNCLDRDDSTQKVWTCENRSIYQDTWGSGFIPPMPARQFEVRPKAILGLCPERETCKAPASLLKAYPVESEALSKQLSKVVKEFSYLGYRIEVYQ